MSDLLVPKSVATMSVMAGEINCYDLLFHLVLITMIMFPDVSYYEQKLKILETETQAAHRRFRSVQKARADNADQMLGIFLKLIETEEMADECSCKIENSQTDDLEQELDGLNCKIRQLAAMLAQGFDQDEKLSGNDLNFMPVLTDLREKCSETREQLKVSRERKEEQMSFRGTVSGVFWENYIDDSEIVFKVLTFAIESSPDMMRLAAIGRYIKGELLSADCFGWKHQDLYKFVE
jgi:hypothetical protein